MSDKTKSDLEKDIIELNTHIDELKKEVARHKRAAVAEAHAKFNAQRDFAALAAERTLKEFNSMENPDAEKSQ